MYSCCSSEAYVQCLNFSNPCLCTTLSRCFDGRSHVGWPLGWLPFINKWKWMNDIAKDFVEANIRARQQGKTEALYSYS